jgi:hypothetical protein
MARGRPVQSEIRQNIIDLLFVSGKMHGYDIYKHYLVLFPRCAQKSVYYNLKKGAALGEFEVEEIKEEKGDFSWGDSAKKVYYKLGKKASPRINKKIKEYFSKKK